jgi:hypothetical protein
VTGMCRLGVAARIVPSLSTMGARGRANRGGFTTTPHIEPVLLWGMAMYSERPSRLRVAPFAKDDVRAETLDRSCLARIRFRD